MKKLSILLFCCFVLITCFTVSCTRTITIRKNLSGLRGKWAKDTSGNFTLYYPVNSFPDSNKNYLRKNIEKYRLDILQIMGEKDYTDKTDVFFFPGKTEMNKALKTNAEGISFANDKVAAFVFSRNFNGLTKHELSHIISINLWGHSALWVEEGFATLTDESFQTTSFHQQVKKILDTKDFIPVENLFKRFNNYNGNWYRYAETASLLKFIKQTYGTAALKSVWTSRKLYFNNKPESELLNEWYLFIKNYQDK